MNREIVDDHVEDLPLYKESDLVSKNAVGGRGEVAYAVVSLYCLRVYLEKSYREALDLLSELPHILGEIGLEAVDFSDHSTLVKWFDRIKTALWRVLLRLSAFTRAELLCSPQNRDAILGRSCTTRADTP